MPRGKFFNEKAGERFDEELCRISEMIYKRICGERLRISGEKKKVQRRMMSTEDW